ncbi:MAG: hypothetical protein P8Y85_04055 [Nitrospirota bacterium]
MTKAQAETVRRFREIHPELCRGKDDEAILLRAKFVEAVRGEIRKERDRRKKACEKDIAWCYKAGALRESAMAYTFY